MFIRENRKKDVCIREIFGHSDLIDGQHTQPRIFELLVDQYGKNFLDLLSNPVGALVLGLHGMMDSSLKLPCNLPSIKNFDLIIDAHVVVIFDTNTTFRTITGRFNLVFEMPQAFELTFIDHDVIS